MTNYRRVALFSFALGACTQQVEQPAVTRQAVRMLTSAEVLADFDQLAEAYRSLYGALKRKQARYNFDFDILVSSYRERAAQAPTESDYVGVFNEFNARFRDAHIGLFYEIPADDYHTYALPLSVMPIEDTYVVYQADDNPSAVIAVGDELLSIDGTPTADLVADFSKYVGVANPVSRKVYAAGALTQRTGVLAEDIVAANPVTLLLRDAADQEREVSVTWRELPSAPYTPRPKSDPADELQGRAIAVTAYEQRLTFAETAGATSFAAAPFFVTPEVVEEYGFSPSIRPSLHTLAIYGVDAGTAQSIDYYAATYTYKHSKLLLLRMPDYQPGDALHAFAYLRALLDEQATQVDGLVFDQTHNGGGYVSFAEAVATLLSTKPIAGIVQAWHADRASVQEYADYAQLLVQLGSASDQSDIAEATEYARTLDDAYSASTPLSPPIPYPGMRVTEDADAAHWAKPLLVLADERSASAADMLPLMVQANHIAPIFGQRTMGAGGNVETVATLTNTRLSLNLSRGLATIYDKSNEYPEARYIEDLGVTPDIAYQHTLADFRAGYVAYVAAFSQAVLDRIQHPDAPASETP